jgi:hypothetical protein
MTLQATAFTVYDAKGIREDLDDVIYRISPEDTPFLSLIGTTPVENTLFEWQTDVLATAITTNAQLEGDAITSVSAITATARVGNYTQIFRKTFGVSGTEEVVKKAGRGSEVSLQKAKKGAELKLDIEATFLNSIGGDAGGTTTARKTATMGAWIKTNDDLGAGGASPVYTSGVPAAARTDGTPRAFTETIHKAVLSAMWTSGARQKWVLMGAVNKGLFSAFAGIATKTYDTAAVKKSAIIASADVYIGEFGRIDALPSRYARTTDAWYFDPEYLSRAVLRPMKTSKLPLAYDGDAYMILTEVGLKCHQESAHGLAADLGG